MESRGFKLSRNKTEYMECNFSTNEITRNTIKLEEKEIDSSRCFKYLGFIFQSNGNIQQDVTHRMKGGWKKWRAATRICDRGLLKLKGKFYRTTI